MGFLNPKIKERMRIEEYDPLSYKTIDWDEMQVKEKHVLLKKARDEMKSTGEFNVLVNVDASSN